MTSHSSVPSGAVATPEKVTDPARTPLAGLCTSTWAPSAGGRTGAGPDAVAVDDERRAGRVGGLDDDAGGARGAGERAAGGQRGAPVVGPGAAGHGAVEQQHLAGPGRGGAVHEHAGVQAAVVVGEPAVPAGGRAVLDVVRAARVVDAQHPQAVGAGRHEPDPDRARTR